MSVYRTIGLLVFYSSICMNLKTFFVFWDLHVLMFLLAHLSQRLIGELIVYPCSGARRHCRCCCRRRRPPFSNIFSETTWPITAKFYVEPPWEGGTKVYINGPGHMTKMADMPIYSKNFKTIFFSRERSSMILKLGM